MKTCCFTGSRPEGFPWGEDETRADCIRLKSEIADAVERLINDGYTHFISGMARGADTYCAEAVLALKRKYADITLEAAVPCPEQAKGWSIEATARRDRILAAADKITTVMPHYTNFCMSKRNEYMVSSSSFVIAVWNGKTSGGTYNTIKHANRLSVPVKIIRIDE